MDRSSAIEGYDLVVEIETGMDLPLVGGADLRKGRALGDGSESDELQRIAHRRAGAIEVVEDIAVGLSGAEDEQVIAAETVQRIGAAAAVDAVVAGVALDEVRNRIAETVE